MLSAADLAKALNRPAVYLSGLQTRFDLPPLQTIRNSHSLLEFLRAIIALRAMNVSEESLRDLWRLEKKLLQLLHVDSAGSPTWYLDACGLLTDRHRRLLLSNYDLGLDLTACGLQLGLDFANRPAELFAGKEMGEDAIRVLTQIVHMNGAIHRQIKSELPHIRSAINWAAPLVKLCE
jgi:hypothetical protein